MNMLKQHRIVKRYGFREYYFCTMVMGRVPRGGKEWHYHVQRRVWARFFLPFWAWQTVARVSTHVEAVAEVSRDKERIIAEKEQRRVETQYL